MFSRLTALAGERSVPWSIDPSSAEMLAGAAERDDVVEAFAGASIIFLENEAAWLAAVDDPTQAADRLLDIAATVVVTCGERGAVVARRGRSTVRVDAVPAEVVSTLGCGDAFAACTQAQVGHYYRRLSVGRRSVTPESAT